jgi:hypothetical protein
VADYPDLWAPGVHEWTNSLCTVTPDGIVSSVAMASAAWPSANLAIYVPVRVYRTCTVYKMATGCGATAGGNFDLGIFTWSGVKLVSTGSTARSASSEVIVDVTDTQLHPGRYWLGMSANGTDNYMTTGAALNAGFAKQAGMRQQATAFALPSTATFATVAQSLVPHIAAYLRSE